MYTSYTYRGTTIRQVHDDPTYPTWTHNYGRSTDTLLHRANTARQCEVAVDHWRDRSCEAHGGPRGCDNV